MSVELRMQYYEEDSDSDGVYNSSSHQIARVLAQGDATGANSGQVKVEYVYEENEMSTKSGIKDGGYVLPPQERNNVLDVQQPTTRPQNKKKPTPRDIYDEDHYTLARNSGFDADFTDEGKHGKTKRKKKKGMITSETIIAISVILGIFAIGGVCAYIVTQRLGTVI